MALTIRSIARLSVRFQPRRATSRTWTIGRPVRSLVVTSLDMICTMSGNSLTFTRSLGAVRHQLQDVALLQARRGDDQLAHVVRADQARHVCEGAQDRRAGRHQVQVHVLDEPHHPIPQLRRVADLLQDDLAGLAGPDDQHVRGVDPVRPPEAQAAVQDHPRQPDQHDRAGPPDDEHQPGQAELAEEQRDGGQRDHERGADAPGRSSRAGRSARGRVGGCSGGRKRTRRGRRPPPSAPCRSRARAAGSRRRAG